MQAAPEGNDRRALVIGSGFGGLAAAVRLAHPGAALPGVLSAARVLDSAVPSAA